jgi:hypothetical protein
LVELECGSRELGVRFMHAMADFAGNTFCCDPLAFDASLERCVAAVAFVFIGLLPHCQEELAFCGLGVG